MLPNSANNTARKTAKDYEMLNARIDDIVRDAGTNDDDEDEIYDSMLSEEYQELSERMNKLYDTEIDDLANYLKAMNDAKNTNNSTNSSTNNTNNDDPKFYNYAATNDLEKDFDAFTAYYESGTVNICAYQVNTNAQSPFLQFFMQKYNVRGNEAVTMPHFYYMYGQDIMGKCDAILNAMFFSFSKQDLGKHKYRGLTVEQDNMYLFFDCSEYEIESHKLCRENEVWLVLVDEILNHKSICDLPIDKYNIRFCEEHPEFMYLTNKNGLPYETPSVSYVGCNKTMSDLLIIFGVPPTIDAVAPLGPYYYLTNYKKAIEQGSLLTKGGIVRFAIFLGNMKVLLNLPTDDQDESQITKQLLSNGSINEDTIRISDRDALWTKEYDSVYIGPNNTSIKDAPIYVIKNYEQQLALSSHVINNSTLNEKEGSPYIY